MTLPITEILGPEGRIAARLPQYESRPQQMEMAHAVGAALQNNRHLVVEAGTGVGKSFAYLVPAILHATEHEGERDVPPKKIVISTHTIALQEQLMTKDLPLLKSVLGREFTSVLVKGRGNYISLRRLQNAVRRSGNLFAAEQERSQIRRLKEWAAATDDGSRSDLPFQPLRSVWDEVASDSGNCLGKRCPTHKQCFYFAARRRAQNAQVLVVNHALFFADLALRRLKVSILPDYDAVVFDEAHTVESVASSHLGLGVTSGQVEYNLLKLYNIKTNKGLLAGPNLGAMQQKVHRCLTRSDEFFSDVGQWLQTQRESNGRVREPEIVPNTLSPALVELAKDVEKYGKRFDNLAERKDYDAAHDRLQALAGEIEAWRTQDIPHAVYWIESQTSQRLTPRLKLCAAPIEIGPVLKQSLFSQTDSVILTSATLSIGSPPSFDFFQKRLGAEDSQTLRVGSPFDYRRQSKLILIDGMPDPGRQRSQYDERCFELIRRYVARTDGHAFVLFTSYDMLRRAARSLTPWLREQNLALYSQADGLPRGQLLDQFKANPRGVLLGTDSFWQGVDVPGEALQNVIITKLPFSVPDHPLLEARLEAIRESGGNPFMEHQVPEAAIKLRQGFGRLIRTRNDRGIVVILDPRVRTKPYGRRLLSSLPECEVIREPAE